MPNNQVQYIEFQSQDLTTIKTFYESAFGWSFDSYGEDAYIAFNGEHTSVGFYKGQPVAGSVLTILYTKTLEDALEKVTSAGGVVTKEIFAFPGGRRFEFTDPDGNNMAVWSDVESDGSAIAHV